MMGTEHEIDPYQVDPLRYLAALDGNLSGDDCVEHYQTLRPALLRLQQENKPAFDVALREVTKTLKIKQRTVLTDLAAMTPPPAAKGAEELLEAMGQTRQLRLAQDFVDGVLWYGVVAGDERLLMNSYRELLPLDQLPVGFKVKDRSFDVCRFSKEAIIRFLKGGVCPDTTLLTDLRAFFSRFAIFRDRRLPLLLATWSLGTYCYRIFRVFPYLALRSPEKRCGKSRVLDELSLVAFNASPRVVHPTEAQLFRGPSRNGGTLLLDEVELLGRADKEMYAGLLAVLNSGFEQGGSVSRFEKTASGNFQEVSFETYCPRAISGIHKLAETLEDRAIIVAMQRKLARERTERFSPTRLEPVAQALRDRCYVWALTHAQDLAEVYEAADHTFSDLNVLDDRARDLWEPLVSITAITDVSREDAKTTLTTELIAHAKDLCQVRDGNLEHSTAAQVLQALYLIAGAEREAQGAAEDRAIAVPPTELASKLAARLGWDKLSPKYLATLLAPFGLSAKKTKHDKNVIRAYHLHPVELRELCERYAGSSEENSS